MREFNVVRELTICVKPMNRIDMNSLDVRDASGFDYWNEKAPTVQVSAFPFVLSFFLA